MTYSREELAPDLGDVDYASVLAARVARFRAVRSDLGESPEDPAMLMLEQSSYWDVVRTEGFRGAIVGSYLDYATGATLAVLGEQRSGLTRGSDESETGYRARVRRAGGLALALGSEESIKATAYGSDSRVIDVAVVWASNGQDASVYIRSSETPSGSDLAGTPSTALLAVVQTALSDDKAYPSDFTYTALAPTLTAGTITLQQTVYEARLSRGDAERLGRIEVYKRIEGLNIGDGLSVFEIEVAAASSTPPTDAHPDDTSALDHAVKSVSVTVPSADLAAAASTCYVIGSDTTDVVITSVAAT